MGDDRYAYAVRTNVNLRSALFSETSLTVFLPYVAVGQRLNASQVGEMNVCTVQLAFMLLVGVIKVCSRLSCFWWVR